MHIVLTICSGFILIAVALALQRITRLVGQCEDHANDAEAAKIAMIEDRHRITALERDVLALRRELRKLSGKFYAEQRMREPPDDDDDYPGDVDPAQGPVCENWTASQTLGPGSSQAGCECGYCLMRRFERQALRAALVPKTVQGQAETARLNASKP
jgi:hypothetical protein